MILIDGYEIIPHGAYSDYPYQVRIVEHYRVIDENGESPFNAEILVPIETMRKLGGKK